jgi:septal ring factor EnvC (AmiA/AmiB activator)
LHETAFPPRRRLAAGLAALLCGLCALAAPAAAGAADVSALQTRVADAKAQAGALAADLRAKQAQMVAAEQQAAAAAAREQQLTSLLAVGEERAARLGEAVDRSQHRLVEERRRLRRARVALAQRLVDIYKSGSPDAVEVVLSSKGFDDLVARTDYLRMIQDSDNALAGRVEQVRNVVRHVLAVTTELKARADAYNVRLASARDQISAVRAAAETQASQLATISASRQATIVSLQSQIGGWVQDIQAARAAAAKAAAEQAQAASVPSAQTEIGRWLGGPYSIPTYIVMCESGGNYGAVNPSSGAGGAYQILPSTWQLYGGSGAPQSGSKAQQDQIAAQIWGDSGGGAWVCAG